MIRIICTENDEKRDLIDASLKLAKLFENNKNLVIDKELNFFKNLYKNPGDIEVAENIVVKKKKDYTHPASIKRSRYDRF